MPFETFILHRTQGEKGRQNLAGMVQEYVLFYGYPFGLGNPRTIGQMMTKYRYVVLCPEQCHSVLPSSVERWIVIEKEGMNEVFEVVKQLHVKYNFKRVVFASEVEVLPALVLNKTLGLGGLPYDTFVAFRDKGIMCSKMVQSGIPVPRFRIVSEFFDFFEFSREEGYPFLIKPTLEASAKGIVVIKSETELEKFCNDLSPWVPGSLKFNYMCQQFIDIKTMYSTNGVYSGGEVKCFFPAKYAEDYLRGMNQSSRFRHVSDISVGPKDDHYQKLLEFTISVMKGFGVPDECTFVFHLEIMLSRDDKFYFCENACRMTGNWRLFEWTKINFYETQLLGQLGEVHHSVPASLAEQPMTDKTFIYTYFCVNRGVSLNLFHEISTEGLKVDVISSKIPKLPLSLAKASTYYDGYFYVTLIESNDELQAQRDLQELTSRVEQACTIEGEAKE